MKNKTVNIEVSENQHEEYSLLISDGRTGYNLTGGKVGGCDSVCDFEINALELIEKVEEYGEISPTRADLIEVLQCAIHHVREQAKSDAHAAGVLNACNSAIKKALGQ